MIKLKELIGLPSLEYHIDNGLSLYENVYRYSSDSFIQLFAEARDAWRDGLIELNEDDSQLLEDTDIGLYGIYQEEKIPLDLPMISEKQTEAELKDAWRKWNSSNPKDQMDWGEYREEHGEHLDEAEYRGKDVPLNKPRRGGSKKFIVYTKNKKGNVVKVSFGGTTGLNVKIDEPGARSSFAARHKCATKKDKTKPGYWSCNIGRYWKSLGGKRNFSGYW